MVKADAVGLFDPDGLDSFGQLFECILISVHQIVGQLQFSIESGGFREKDFVSLGKFEGRSASSERKMPSESPILSTLVSSAMT